MHQGDRPSNCSSSFEDWTSSFDDPVQATADDAALCKASAVATGYYQDPYLRHMVKRPPRRSPLINRGFYARVAALRQAMLTFFELVPPTTALQVVSLGSGLDTTFFWVNDILTGKKEKQLSEILSSPLPQEFRRSFTYFELDQPEVQERKAQQILRSPDLMSVISDDGQENVDDHHGRYITAKRLKMVSCDLRQIDAVDVALRENGFNVQLPTLFLSECCLIYLQSDDADKVISWAASACQAPSAFVCYEQIRPHDPFGKTMTRNLLIRGCPLLALEAYPELEDLEKRYIRLGWKAISVQDMNFIYDYCLPPSDVVRIQRLELFDEMEEWKLMQKHYAIAVAVMGSEGGGQEPPTEMVQALVGDRCPTTVAEERFQVILDTAAEHLDGSLNMEENIERILTEITVLRSAQTAVTDLTKAAWTAKQTGLGYLGALTKVWTAPPKEVIMPRFTSSQMKHLSSRDITQVTQDCCSEQEQRSLRSHSFNDLLGLEQASQKRSTTLSVAAAKSLSPSRRSLENVQKARNILTSQEAIPPSATWWTRWGRPKLSSTDTSPDARFPKVQSTTSITSDANL